MQRADSNIVGAIQGLILPALTAFVTEILKADTRILGKDHIFYILSVAFNLLLARYLFKSDKDHAAYGVLASTFFCAIVFLVFKGRQ